MSAVNEDFANYTRILKDELLPAMGCTEPIAVAYAAAKAGEALGQKTAHLNVRCSGNIIKNVKGVVVPNSGNQKGIEVAAALGIIGGNPSKALEVIANVTDDEKAVAGQMVRDGFCEVELEENVPNLFIRAEAVSFPDTESGTVHRASVTIKDTHTNVTHIEKDGEVIFDSGPSHTGDEHGAGKGDPSLMTLKGVVEYAAHVDLDEVRELLERQIRDNSAIAQEGIDNPWGARVGKTILENWGGNVKARAAAFAAAGSDARMSGCPLPVVINSGSGNQGITVTMPVVIYAEEWHVSRDKMLRALIVSNLTSIYIKHYIGALSAFCGAVSASAAAGAAITYLSGGDFAAIGRTITNTLGNVGGIVCDGAKPSCAAKIASSVHAALLAHYMSISEKGFKGGEGFVESDIEKTIKNMGYIGKVGMKETDVEILNLMIDKVDVNTCM